MQRTRTTCVLALACFGLFFTIHAWSGQEGGGKSKAETVAEIEGLLDKCREMIRDGQRYAEALTLLAPLAAKVFTIDDRTKQMELATEVFLLKGVALAGTGDVAAAKREFQSMFALNPALAKAASRNIYDPRIVALLREAEGAPAKPPAAPAEKPAAPIEKPPAPVEKPAEKRLPAGAGRLSVRSNPAGAAIFIDGNDTAQVTDAQLSGLAAGAHTVKLVKDYYADWETKVQVAGSGAPAMVDARLIAVSYMSSGTWGDPDSGRFAGPEALFIGKDNIIYVLDRGEAKITLFTESGESQVVGQDPPGGLAEIISPAGIAVDGKGMIYVSDSESHFVFVLDRSGRIVARWGGLGNADTEFNTPMGLTVDAKNRIYVADAGNACVKIFNSQGQFLKAVRTAATSGRRLEGPRAVAVNPKGEAFVLDRDKVVKFSADGAPASSFGREGSGDGEFLDPLGISLDADGSVYVADTGNHRVQKFDGQGKLLCAWGGRGSDPGMLNSPCDVAVDGRGAVYVAENENHRIQIFVAGSSALGASKH